MSKTFGKIEKNVEKERCKRIRADDFDFVHILKFWHLQESRTGVSWKLEERLGMDTDFVSFLRKIESKAINWECWKNRVCWRFVKMLRSVKAYVICCYLWRVMHINICIPGIYLSHTGASLCVYKTKS